MPERVEKRERLFDGVRIYFSNSIFGDMGGAADMGEDIVRFLSDNGADVLSEHVACQRYEDRLSVFEKRTGIDLNQVDDPVEYAQIVRGVDIGWVDEATHMLAIVNGASYGVGMELQRAIDKPKMGMNKTPILCLVHKSRLDNLSRMIKGIDPENEGCVLELYTYDNLTSAKEAVEDFLQRNK